MERVSEFRYCYVLPNPKIAEFRSDEIKSVYPFDLPSFISEDRWWKYEEFLSFSGEEVENDLLNFCDGCGECCRNLPSRNIGMYMSEKEVERVEKFLNITRDAFIAGWIEIEGVKFGVIKVKDNGDCWFLNEDGRCIIHHIKPVWCKIWICEKMKERFAKRVQGGEKPVRDNIHSHNWRSIPNQSCD